jgi:plastocyanin
MRSTHSSTTLAALVGALALVVASCGGSTNSTDEATTESESVEQPEADTSPTPTDAASAPSATASVGISTSRFDPLVVAVEVGGTVTFTNNDPFAHTITANDDQAVSFDSGDLGQDETFEVTFDEAGTFDYFCEIHPTMRATVTVG